MVIRFCLCLSMCLLYACSLDTEMVPSVGTLERDRIELIADSNEPILQILVREGDIVEVDEVILIQDVTRQQAQLERASAERDAALARLREAESGPRAQEIERGRARLEAARSAVKTAKYELDREKALVAKNYASKNLVDILQGRYEEAIARQEEAAAALDELREGTRSELIDQTRSTYMAARAAVTEYQIAVDRTTVRATSAGIIESLPYEAGERPTPGSTVAAIIADGISYARVYVTEPYRTRLTSGAEAEIVIDGYDKTFKGRLRWISSDASFTPYFALTQQDRSQLSYLAEIDLIDADAGKLPVGIPVEVYFPQLQP